MPRVTSEKQIQANRANAALSTGPITPEGKAAVAQNSVTHGLHAKAIVLTGGHEPEDPAEFSALLDRLYADFNPQDDFECACVARMAVCSWRSRRAYKYEVASLLRNAQRCPEDSPRNHLPDQESLNLLVRYESLLDRQFTRAHQRFVANRQLKRLRALPNCLSDATPPLTPFPVAAVSGQDVAYGADPTIGESAQLKQQSVYFPRTQSGHRLSDDYLLASLREKRKL